MPSTVNGFGTSYWGRRHVFTRRDFCPSCGRLVELRSYDTTYCVVALYLPLIPLGRRRVVGYCPLCTKHRAMKLRDWENGRREGVPEAFSAWQRQKHDRDALRNAIAAAVLFEDGGAFDRVVGEMGNIGADDAGLLTTLGAAYEFFERLEPAEEAYRSAWALSQSDTVNTLLILNLLRQSRPDDAWPFMEHIITQQNAEHLDLLRLGVEGFQAIGGHDRALYVIEACEKAFPTATTDKQWKRLRKISEKNLGTAKVVKSATLAPPTPVDIRGNPWIARAGRLVLPAVLLLGVVLYLLAADRAGKAREIVVVNGLPVEYVVEVNGRRCPLPAKGHRTLTVPEGDLTVRVLTDGLYIPEQTCHVETSFLSRPFSKHTFVLNPDRTALLLWEEVEYSAQPDPDDQGKQVLHVGELLNVFAGLDYEFAEFPDQISTLSSGSVKKQRIAQLDGFAPVMALQVIGSMRSAEDAVAFAGRQPLRDPAEELLLPVATSLLPPEEVLPYVRKMLGDRPVRIEAHRFYQEYAQRKTPEHDLVAEYRGYLDAEPDNPDCCYLLARVVADPAASEELLQRARQLDPRHARVIGALAYARLTDGQFSEALDLIREAQRLAPSSYGFQRHEREMLHALGNLAELHDRIRQASDLPAFVEDVELDAYALHRLGRADEARQLIDEFLTNSAATMDAATQLETRLRLDALASYLEGRVDDYVAALQPSQVPKVRFIRSLIAGDLAAARSALESDTDARELWPLLLYIRAEGDDAGEMAVDMLSAATTMLRAGSADERRLAALFEGANAPGVQRALNVAFMPDQKRIALVALGLRFPELRGACFEMARKLNYDRRFPYLLLAQVLTKE